jgi:pimeloyl-ACP methyl ester carboxylesterase
MSVVLVLVLTAVTGYTAYVGAVGSDVLVDPAPDARCGTPLVQFGWDYEAINYDITDDARLMAANPDPDRCSDQGSRAGSDVVTSDGVSIAGWYIPAADGTGPTGPTVILVHGWNANKSEILRYAVPLHDRFNVVVLDLRHGGRSGGDQITFGVQERLDVRAIVDWLERTKAPRAIGVMGNSMGGATAAAAAVEDPRIRAVLLDSTHASALDVFGRRLSVEEGHPPVPGSWAMALGIWLRTGHAPGSSDPVGTVPRLGDRPVLLIHGTDDPIDVPADSAERTLAAARAAGVDIELRYCVGGRHGDLIDHCRDEWGAWAGEFFARSLTR